MNCPKLVVCEGDYLFPGGRARRNVNRRIESILSCDDSRKTEFETHKRRYLKSLKRIDELARIRAENFLERIVTAGDAETLCTVEFNRPS